MNDIQKGLVFVLVLLSLALGGWILLMLSPVLAPFLVAAALAYLCDPVVEKLSHEGRFTMPRTLAVTLVFTLLGLLFLVLFLYLIPILHHQIKLLIQALPQMFTWVQEVLFPKIEGWTGIEVASYDLAKLQATLTEHWSKASNIMTWAGQWLYQSSMRLVHAVVNVILIFVVTFYLLRDWHKLLEGLKKLMPQSYRETIVRLIKKSDVVMGSFLRGQLGVMLCLGIIYAVGLTLIGVQFSVLLGLGAGLLSIVPYLGSIVGLAGTLIVALVQAQDIWMFVWVGLVFGVGQLIEGMILTPLLVGDKLGLHPVAVIFAVLAGGQLFGMVGILVAIPVTAILVVLLREPLLGWARTS